MELEQLTAVVQETTFRNDVTAYTRCAFTVGRAQQTVVGQMPELSSGENITFEGTWLEHPVYGKQFSARTCAITPPTGKSAIEKYLGSGLIRGIGPSTAKLIVKHFGEKAIDILDEHPERLTEIPGHRSQKGRDDHGKLHPADGYAARACLFTKLRHQPKPCHENRQILRREHGGAYPGKIPTVW